MRRLLVLALLAGACGGAIVTPSPAPTVVTTASSAATVRPSPSPAPTPVTSSKGGITITAPLTNARVTSPVTITGNASVFEAALQWRIVDAGGAVIASGIATASAGAPARGTFSISASFTPPAAEVIGGIEVFDRSPKDGSIDELVRVPVVIGR